VVCSLCRWRGGSGRKVLCSPIVLPTLSERGRKRRPGSAKLTMPNRHWLISYDIALRHLGPPAPQPANVPSPLAFADPDYIRGFLAEAGFAEVTVDRAHPTIIGGSPEEEAQQAMMMGPTARLIEEKTPAELMRQTIAREIEAAFTAEASSGLIRLPATIFVVAARRPVSMQ
jgi:hypothetical protein